MAGAGGAQRGKLEIELEAKDRMNQIRLESLARDISFYPQ